MRYCIKTRSLSSAVLRIECHAKAPSMSPSAAPVTRKHRQCHEMQRQPRKRRRRQFRPSQTTACHENRLYAKRPCNGHFGRPQNGLGVRKMDCMPKGKERANGHLIMSESSVSAFVALHVLSCSNYTNYAETISARKCTIFLSESCCFLSGYG
jgi:hypothetical protein